MDALPNELLIQIASHLDGEPPSITKYAHEPSIGLTYSTSTPLKSLSLMSWRWRKLVLPILFSYARFPLDKDPQWAAIDARLVDSMQGQLTTLSNHEFLIYQNMRSKFKSTSVFAFDETFDDLLINLCRAQEGDNFLNSVPQLLWLPHLHKKFNNFVQFVSDHMLKSHIKSLVVYTEEEYRLHHASTADAPLSRAVQEIWSQIFSCLNPVRIVVAAPPSTLAGLLDTQMLSSDTWAFDMKMHYIELLQSRSLGLEHEKEACRPWGTILIHKRPWSHLSYNEGSSNTAYSTYEYHLKQSPKMLYLILVRLAKEAQACCNITSFSFIGVFPFATNITTITRALHRIPALQKVSFQLAPGPENNLLDDPKRMGRAQHRDFWLEWTESYKVIASYLGVYDFSDGSTFKSEDCGSEQQAIEVEDCMDLLRKRGAGWRKQNRYTWIRDHVLDDETVTHITGVVNV
ncbi:hypothetical protein ACN47E_008368 [Coniothyrium glycines]